MLWLNGQAVEEQHWNRGLAFGDGVFETVAFRHRQAALWPWHVRRLQHACDTLMLQMPDPDQLQQQCLEMLPQDDGVVRITLVRRAGGSSGNAYAPGEGICATDTWLRFRPLPQTPEQGLRTDWGKLRLASQPALAGLKHLNRLEQVLAARDAARLDLDELLLMDGEGHVIEAISSNLLVYDGAHWLTPDLHDSGVAGVMRQWLLDGQLVGECSMRQQDIEQASALALCNSVRGIQPVSQHAGRGYPQQPVDDLRRTVRNEGLI